MFGELVAAETICQTLMTSSLNSYSPLDLRGFDQGYTFWLFAGLIGVRLSLRPLMRQTGYRTEWGARLG
jgi:hypothetical protein